MSTYLYICKNIKRITIFTSIQNINICIFLTNLYKAFYEYLINMNIYQFINIGIKIEINLSGTNIYSITFHDKNEKNSFNKKCEMLTIYLSYNKIINTLLTQKMINP